MTSHPLDPLSADEITSAAQIVRSQSGLHGDGWFETITLEEPERDALAAFANGKTIPRVAYVCCYEPESNRTFRGLTDLGDEKLTRWDHVPGVQARIGPDEFDEGDRIAKADPRFREACALRGITDMDTVLVEPWAAGNFGIAEEAGERIAYGHCWAINAAGDNRYGRPLANVHPVIDLRRRKLIRVDDFGVVPLPPDTAAIRPTENLRTDVKPLEITQPDGPSFTVDGYHVAWQKWQLRIGFNLREGLVLHTIGYEDGGRLRPIMHRASLAEMVVPYGNPAEGQFRRNAFDTGEYGIGGLLDSLKLGCDCLGHIHYFDVASHNWAGAPDPIKNAICMHEEDYGLLWKHTDTHTGKMRAVRSRRLVISSISTIGNYVYGFYWYFYQDGTIGVEVKATGIPFPSAIEDGKASAYGAVIAPGIESHVHQHVFSFRFDMCVDGPKNSVREIEFESLPMGPENRQGNAIAIRERELASELEAQRTMDLARSRTWKVVNPGVRNHVGQEVGYKLAPGNNALPMLHPTSPMGRRAAFMFKHFWATPYASDERFPAGWFPNQHAGGGGLPAWTKADRPLTETNVVVWHTVNIHHLPRAEDWPVQPVVYANFHWMPENFFDQNPALDVPPKDFSREA